jgi:hypothetical protein
MPSQDVSLYKNPQVEPRSSLLLLHAAFPLNPSPCAHIKPTWDRRAQPCIAAPPFSCVAPALVFPRRLAPPAAPSAAPAPFSLSREPLCACTPAHRSCRRALLLPRRPSPYPATASAAPSSCILLRLCNTATTRMSSFCILCAQTRLAPPLPLLHAPVPVRVTWAPYLALRTVLAPPPVAQVLPRAGTETAQNRPNLAVFSREIRSSRCISAAGKAWNRTPSLSSFFSPTSRALPWSKSLQFWPTGSFRAAAMEETRAFAIQSPEKDVIFLFSPVSCRFCRKPPISFPSFQSSPTMEFFRSNPNLFCICEHYFLCLVFLFS